MTNKEALNILKDRKIAYEVVITRTASHENRHMAEEELKLINACIIALEHMRKSAETVDAIPTEWIVGRLHSLYKSEMFASSQDEYTEALERLLQEWWKWRKENESNADN